MSTSALSALPTTPTLPPSTRLLLALSTRAVLSHPSFPVSPSSSSAAAANEWWTRALDRWSSTLCKLIDVDIASLPRQVAVDDINSAARRRWDDLRSDHDPERGDEDDGVEHEWNDIVEVLVLSSVFTPPIDEETTQIVRLPESNTTTSSLAYHPTSRTFAYIVTTTLLIPPTLIPSAEHRLSTSLFHALRVATADDDDDANPHDDSASSSAAAAAAQHQIESTRAASSSGWGGPLGRNIATTLGVTLGGLALGLTGGLAAPAIAALAPGFLVALVGGAATAPVVLGSVFGIAGGGLAGRRVRERWSGVGEFEFVDLKRAGAGAGAGEREGKREGDGEKWAYEPRRKKVVPRQGEDETASITTASTTTATEDIQDIQDNQDNPPDKLDLGVEPRCGRVPATETVDQAEAEARTEGGQQPPPPPPPPPATDKAETQRSSTTDVENRVDPDKGDASTSAAAEAGATGTTAEIEQRTKTLNMHEEAGVDVDVDVAEGRAATTEGKRSEDKTERVPSLVATIAVPGLLTVSPTEAIQAWANHVVPRHFHDRRDVYVLRYETELMLTTGRAVEGWVNNKLKGYVKGQVIKRTVLSAYFAAVSLPLSVYSMATMSLDNTWMQAQDKARKAGRLLGEVLEKRVQGQRPVVLIGSSLGALTVLHALLYLSSLSPPSCYPQLVDSAFLISLPSAPSPDEWKRCRNVVARRVVNAWCGNDLVLAGVVRLHEVLSRATTLQSGIRVAGLGPVSLPGVEDVDLTDVVDGHMDLQVKMPDILQVLRVDA